MSKGTSFIGSVEIIINLAHLIEGQNDLAKLSSDIAKRKIDSSYITSSTGDIAQELLSIGESLQKAGEALSLLAQQCSGVLKHAAETSEKMDTLTIPALYKK